MPLTNNRFTELWNKYVSSTCSRTEMEELLLMIKKMPAVEQEEWMADTDRGLLESWETPLKNSLLNQPDWDESWDKINERTRPVRKLNKMNWWYWSVAASVVGIMVFVSAIYFKPKKETAQQHIATLPQLVSTLAKNDTMHLPDGTLVMLKTNAKITVVDFNEKERTILLTGEAFFDVKHDAKRPFTVLANNVKVRVLGTAFLVSALPGKKVEVRVTRGRVQVSHLDKILSILTPAQAIFYDEQKNEAKLEYKIDTTQIQMTKPTQEWRWQEVKLADVTAWLETHFNTHIIIADEQIKQEAFSASFPEPLSLQDVLNVISKVYGLNIKQMDNGDYVLSLEK